MSELIEQLNWRYATKAFDPGEKLSDQQVDLLKESLRLTASSFGLQPWKFLFVTDQETRDKMPPVSWGQRQPADCSHLIVMCAPRSFGEADIDRFLDSIVEQRAVGLDSLSEYSQVMKGFLASMDEDAINAWVRNQIYLALGSLLVVCATEGIDACPMEGFDADAYDRILGLEEQGLRAVVLCPVGFRSADDKYAEFAKVRYAESEVIG